MSVAEPAPTQEREDVLAKRRVKRPLSPDAYLISTAPVRPGRRFGPCLLWPYTDRWDPKPRWDLGKWEDGGWCDHAGFFFQPTHWSPLPKEPAAILTSGAAGSVT
jgi:hypothetical protein